MLNARADRELRADERLASSTDVAHHAIVVGYGPIGRTVVRLLQNRGIEPTVIEMNLDTRAVFDPRASTRSTGMRRKTKFLSKRALKGSELDLELLRGRGSCGSDHECATT
jgi:voltage-gated potassium channel Kch